MSRAFRWRVGAALVPLALATPAAAQELSGAPEPGAWRYVASAATSEAIFADGALRLRCDRGRRLLSLVMSPAAVGTVRIVTDMGAMPVGGGLDLPPALSAFDALGFARGKFGISMSGRPGTILYPWDSIVARSIEDCRK